MVSSCSNAEESLVTNNAAKNTTTAAPTSVNPILIVRNNTSNVNLVLGCIFAQTTTGANAPVQISHKDAAFATILPNTEIKYYDYVNTAPPSAALNWWNVNDSNTVPLLSGINSSATVQSTYGTAIWQGLFVTATTSLGVNIGQTGQLVVTKILSAIFLWGISIPL